MTSARVRSSAALEPKRTTTIVRMPEAAAAPGFGVHLTLDGYGGCRHLLGDGNHVLACLNELPDRLGMHKLAEPFLVELGDHSPKDPGGVSGVQDRAAITQSCVAPRRSRFGGRPLRNRIWEPGTGSVGGCSKIWRWKPNIEWAREDSNLRPTDYESAALTN